MLMLHISEAIQPVIVNVHSAENTPFCIVQSCGSSGCKQEHTVGPAGCAPLAEDDQHQLHDEC